MHSFVYSPYVVKKVSEIMELVGVMGASSFPPHAALILRRKNSIKTIASTLQIEGNTLGIVEVTAIMNGHRVIGIPNEILEIENAIKLYGEIERFDPLKENNLLRAHKMLISKLIKSAGHYRKVNVGVVGNQGLKYVAPDYDQVSNLMLKTFKFMKDCRYDHLVMGILGHYQIETVHPFEDGNGRMGRFYQTLYHSHFISRIFNCFSVEAHVFKYQQKYYQALNRSQKQKNSNYFVEYMLNMIQDALDEYFKESNKSDFANRLKIARDYFKSEQFKRIDYLKLNPGLSTATASRDLKQAFERKIISKTGSHNKTHYKFKDDQDF